jgi:heme oxygenase
MRLVDRLSQETGPSHADVDQGPLRAPVSARGYQRYLARTFGFVAPVERSIVTTPRIDKYVDFRRFNKEELLRRDMLAMHASTAQINAIHQCAVPLFDVPEEALGWAYFIERSTLSHGALFRHLASGIPGEVAFASSYLKCYLGSVGEMWRSFGEALEMIAREGDAKAARVIHAAKAAFRSHASWQHDHDLEPAITSSSARPTHA